MHFLRAVAFQVPCFMAFYLVVQDTGNPETCGPGTIDCNVPQHMIDCNKICLNTWAVKKDGDDQMTIYRTRDFGFKAAEVPSSHGKKYRDCEP